MNHINRRMMRDQACRRVSANAACDRFRWDRIAVCRWVTSDEGQTQSDKTDCITTQGPSVSFHCTSHAWPQPVPHRGHSAPKTTGRTATENPMWPASACNSKQMITGQITPLQTVEGRFNEVTERPIRARQCALDAHLETQRLPGISLASTHHATNRTSLVCSAPAL